MDTMKAVVFHGINDTEGRSTRPVTAIARRSRSATAAGTLRRSARTRPASSSPRTSAAERSCGSWRPAASRSRTYDRAVTWAGDDGAGGTGRRIGRR